MAMHEAFQTLQQAPCSVFARAEDGGRWRGAGSPWQPSVEETRSGQRRSGDGSARGEGCRREGGSARKERACRGVASVGLQAYGGGGGIGLRRVSQ